MSINLLDKHEKRLKLQHVKRRFWEETQKYVKQGNAIFKVPIPPKEAKTTYRWFIGISNISSNVYMQQFAPKLDDSDDPCQLRRDARINYADAMFQPEKKPKEEENKVPEPEELTEAQLRSYKEYETFFESWDEAQYTEEEMYELMQSAVNDRIEIYQEIYKVTSNEAYLGQAVFLKFLDLERLSNLHRMYLVLSEECDFSIAYVEMILRRHYEQLP
ncbi:hypothetical protein CAEBREN_20847 [Caenorhabditis brenneri]|uniref:Uncharacterized protein n=1 Tax=Caenorhabditis brenneri TaxID=135651 RepID=G0MSS4_CAEBE|nr:hypothetical protein CAEBREN_20847 [Caenorhabditis brenneri]